MSIRQRLEQAETEAQLHDAMHELRVSGSPNWTHDAAIRFVHPSLWNALDRHFDARGRLLACLPDVAADPPGGVTRAEHGPEARASHPPALSISALVADFHGELEAIRRAAPEGRYTQRHAALEPAAVEETTEAEEGAPDPAGAAEPEAQDTRFLCPI